MLGVSERVIFLKHNSDPVVPIEGGMREVVSLIRDLIPGITEYVNSCARLSGQKRRVTWAVEDEDRTVLPPDILLSQTHSRAERASITGARRAALRRACNRKKPKDANTVYSQDARSAPDQQTTWFQQYQQMKQMQQMLEDGKQPGKKPGEKPCGQGGQAKQFAKMAAQQEAIRKQLEELLRENGEDGSGAANEIREALEQMDKTEEELLNQELKIETLKRQEEILSKLLKAENAEREKEKDKEREARPLSRQNS